MPARAFTVSLNPAIDRTLWVDRLRPGHTHAASGEHRQAGGKGFNVAAGLSSLHVPVTMTGWLGADNAAVFESAFATRGIVDAMTRVPGAVRENLQVGETEVAQTTSVELPGLALAPAERAAAEAALVATLQRDLAAGDWCLLTGSLPPGTDVGTLERLARAAAARRAWVVVDTGGEVLAELVRRLAGSAQPVFLKPNRAELEACCGRALPTVADVVGAARELTRAGVAQVLVSLGADGAVGVSGASAWIAPVPAVPVCTTVGAGDAVVAGTVAALMAGQAFDAAARHGLACAAWRIQRRTPDLPPPAEASALSALITPIPFS